MEKPTEQEYLKALEVVRAYSPERFVDTEKVELKNALQGNMCKVVVKDGYFLLLTPSGEILPCQLSVQLNEGIEAPLKATCTLHVEFHKIKE